MNWGSRLSSPELVTEGLWLHPRTLQNGSTPAVAAANKRGPSLVLPLLDRLHFLEAAALLVADGHDVPELVDLELAGVEELVQLSGALLEEILLALGLLQRVLQELDLGGAPCHLLRFCFFRFFLLLEFLLGSAPLRVGFQQHGVVTLGC